MKTILIPGLDVSNRSWGREVFLGSETIDSGSVLLQRSHWQDGSPFSDDPELIDRPEQFQSHHGKNNYLLITKSLGGIAASKANLSPQAVVMVASILPFALKHDPTSREKIEEFLFSMQTVPSLWVQGEKDDKSTPDEIEKMIDGFNLTGAEITPIPEAGHDDIAPKEVSGLIDSFAAKLRP